LWNWLSGRILPEGHYTRIESESSAGFPDVHYTIGEISGTMELKFCRFPKLKNPLQGKDLGFRRSQIIWIADEFIAGGWTALIVQIDDVVRVYHPSLVAYINDYSQKELANKSSLVLNKRDPSAQQVRNLKDFLLRRL